MSFTRQVPLLCLKLVKEFLINSGFTHLMKISENMLEESLKAAGSARFTFAIISCSADADKRIQNGLNAPEPLLLAASFVLTAHRKPLSISRKANISAAYILHYVHLMYGLP